MRRRGQSKDAVMREGEIEKKDEKEIRGRKTEAQVRL